MSKKGGDPPKAPDYGPLIEASKEAAAMAQQTAAEQLAWAKEQYAKDMEIATPIIEAATKRMQLADQWAQEDRARYKSVFQPLEDQLVADANSYASGERRDLEAGRDMANVAQQMELSRQTSQRNLEAYGIDPSSTRYAALDIGARTAEAAAKAAAGNEAIRRVDDTGRALRTQAIDIGRGYPGQANQAAGLATGSGQAGSATGLNTTASGANTMGTGTQWFGAGTGALGQAGGLMGSAFSAQMDRYNAKQAQSNMYAQLAGTALGVGAGMYFNEGGKVPAEVSPSRGRAIDDVPARLTAGEFIIPAHIVKRKGEEFFERLISGTEKKQAGRQAIAA